MPILALLGAGVTKIWTVIAGFIAFSLPYWVYQTVKSLGLGYTLYVGFDIVFGQIFTFIFSYYDNFPAHLLQLLDLAGLHKALSILASTVSTIAIWKAAQASTLRRKKQLLT